jgi:preprotein translocase subunit SecG
VNVLRYILVIMFSVLGVAEIILIFLHSGKDAGLSSMLGGGGSSGGGGVVQKNLDRLTVACSILFVGVAIGLAYILKG